MKHEINEKNGDIIGSVVNNDGYEVTYSVTSDVIEKNNKDGIDIVKELQAAAMAAACL